MTGSVTVSLLAAAWSLLYRCVRLLCLTATDANEASTLRWLYQLPLQAAAWGQLHRCFQDWSSSVCSELGVPASYSTVYECRHDVETHRCMSSFHWSDVFLPLDDVKNTSLHVFLPLVGCLSSIGCGKNTPAYRFVSVAESAAVSVAESAAVSVAESVAGQLLRLRSGARVRALSWE